PLAGPERRAGPYTRIGCGASEGDLTMSGRSTRDPGAAGRCQNVGNLMRIEEFWDISAPEVLISRKRGVERKFRDLCTRPGWSQRAVDRWPPAVVPQARLGAESQHAEAWLAAESHHAEARVAAESHHADARL